MTRERRSPRMPWAALLFLAWSLWLSFPYFAFGPASYVKVHDCGDALLPARLAAASGGFSWWFAGGVCGTDGIASAVAGNADQIVFDILPGWLAYGLVMWIVRFAAGYFFYLLAADALGLDALPSVCGGLFFSLFPQSAVNYHWSGLSLADGAYLALMPLTLWGIYRAERFPPLAGAACAAGLGALYALSASYALTPFFVPVVFLWCWSVAPPAGRNRWRLPAAFALGWCVGASPFLWAGLANGPRSHRASVPARTPFSAGTHDPAAFAAEMLRNNAAPLLVALIAAFRVRDRRILVPAGAVAAALLFLFVYRPVREFSTARLGFVSGIQLNRFYLCVPFLAAAGGSAGLHFLGRGRGCGAGRIPSLLRRVPALLLAALAVRQSVPICRRILAERRGGSNYSALYLRPGILRLARERDARAPFRVATVAGSLFHPSCVWAYGLESADGYFNLYPKRYREFWEAVISPLSLSDAARRDYLHYWGNRVYLFPPTGGFPGAGAVRFRDYYDLDLLSLANVRYLLSPRPLADGDLLPLFQAPGGDCGGAPLYAYENRGALPRFFLARAVVPCEGGAQVLRAVKGAGRGRLLAAAFVERGECGDLPEGGGGEVEVRRCAADRIELRTRAEAASLLVILNGYSPFWEARVDGAAARIIPVDHAFQGVVVGAGTRRVELEYSPPYARLFRRFGFPR